VKSKLQHSLGRTLGIPHLFLPKWVGGGIHSPDVDLLMGSLNSFLTQGGGNLNKHFAKIKIPGGLTGEDDEASI